LAGNALGLAGVEFQWKLTPAKRQLMLLERGEGLDCGVGWYKSRERERFGQFTLPIYRDRPTLALARQGYVPPLGGRLADVLADPAARVLVKDGLTYGRDAEALLSGPGVRARVQKSTAEQVTLLHMVAADRADLMLSPAEEASLLMGQLRPEEQALKRIEFSDVGEGQTRHILCSRRVDKATMDLINAALVVLTQLR
jgi:polar amino acid transport system substrate-binding protein